MMFFIVEDALIPLLLNGGDFCSFLLPSLARSLLILYSSAIAPPLHLVSVKVYFLTCAAIDDYRALIDETSAC